MLVRKGLITDLWASGDICHTALLAVDGGNPAPDDKNPGPDVFPSASGRVGAVSCVQEFDTGRVGARAGLAASPKRDDQFRCLDNSANGGKQEPRTTR